MIVKIKDIAYYLPETIIDNQYLHDENRAWDMKQVVERTGVEKRHIAGEGETALDLSLQACEQLFSKHEEAAELIDGLIFCTQSGDYIMPPNACILHKLLNLPENVFAFDFNLACSGYIYGLALARGLVFTGQARNILLVTADTYSKYIHRKDRSARVLFGDGAAVTWLSGADSGPGVIDILCSTGGKEYDRFIIPAGGCRLPKSRKTARPKKDESGNVRTLENIYMDGLGILAFVNSRVPKQIRQILARNSLTISDIDLFIFHQASKLALDSLAALLKIEPGKEFRNLQEVGNTVSASIPIALKDAMDAGRAVPGDKILISGFGVGLSWGTALIEM